MKRLLEIPELMLENFTDETGRVHCHRNVSRDIVSGEPATVYAEQHACSATEDSSLDEEFNELGELAKPIELAAQPVIEKILDCVRIEERPCLTRKEKTDWDRFFWFNLMRTQFILFSAIGAAMIKRAEKVRCDNDYASGLNDSDAVDELSEVERLLASGDWERSLMDRSKTFWDSLSRRGLLYQLIQRPRKSFVLGNAPIIAGGLSKTLMDGKDSRLIYPIAPDVAVVSYGSADEESLSYFPTNNEGTKWLRQLNKEIWAQSTLVASSSRPLLESLSRPSRG